ncbi:YCF48-related protein [Edaphocola aurantiacus]|uniref:YCF48-related protein n=1 Tax=Edaphocola aurantiacus TaxID=2601682 RepID=UPI001C957FCA|nr:YCF48-related protein [Edaphocola aurantiacus]
MNWKHVSLLAVMLSPLSVSAGWTKLNTATTKDLNTIHFLNNNLGFVAGKDGVMLKTSNAGTSWSSLSTSFGEDINTIFFTDENTGWIAGKDGKIKKTSNGGSTWVAQNTGTDEDINSIHFINANQGIAAGDKGLVLVTVNGGTTWTNYSLVAAGSGSGSDDDGIELLNVQWTNTSTAYISGKDGYFAMSTNGGHTWTQQASGTTADLEGMHFYNATTGYVCYQTGGVRKTNGSGSFTSVTAATSKDLSSIFFVTATNGWTVGKEGRIQHTTNSGSSWTAENISTVTSDLNDVYFPTETSGFIAGDDGIVLRYEPGSNPNPTAVQELDAATSGIVVYPNPFSTAINLELSHTAFTQENITLTVTNLIGQIVYAQKLAHARQISIPAVTWPAGTYFITVRSDQFISTIHLVK